MDDPPSYRKLKLELAVTVDASEPFVKTTYKTTYKLEGDGALVFTTYEQISSLQATISSGYYPNVSAVANNLATVPSHSTQLICYAKSCVKPAYDYFQDYFPLSIFKYARLFDPSKVM